MNDPSKASRPAGAEHPWTVEARFEVPGSLPTSGPVGRVVPLLVGGFMWRRLSVVIDQGPGAMPGPAIPRNPTLWLGLAFALYVTRYLVNLASR